MFCGKCGALVKDGIKFCGSCGAVIEAESVPAQTANNSSNTPPDKKKIDNRLIGIVACAAVLIVVIFALFSAFGGDKPEAVLKKYIQASANFDYNNVSKYTVFDVDNLIEEVYTSEGLTSKEFGDLLYDYYGIRSIKEYFNMMKDEAVIEFQNEYGKNYRITVEVVNTKKLTKEETDSKVRDLETWFSRRDYNSSKIIRLDKITEMVEIEVDITISGREGSDTERVTFVCAKISGKWRVFDDIYQYIPF